MDDLRSTLQESWSRAVLAAGSAEAQAQELVRKLSARAELSGDQAKKLAAELASKLSAERSRLKAQLDGAVEQGLAKAKIPTAAALKALAARLTELERRLTDHQEKP